MLQKPCMFRIPIFAILVEMKYYRRFNVYRGQTLNPRYTSLYRYDVRVERGPWKAFLFCDIGRRENQEKTHYAQREINNFAE